MSKRLRIVLVIDPTCLDGSSLLCSGKPRSYSRIRHHDQQGQQGIQLQTCYALTGRFQSRGASVSSGSDRRAFHSIALGILVLECQLHLQEAAADPRAVSKSGHPNPALDSVKTLT